MPIGIIKTLRNDIKKSDFQQVISLLRHVPEVCLLVFHFFVIQINNQEKAGEELISTINDVQIPTHFLSIISKVKNKNVFMEGFVSSEY